MQLPFCVVCWVQVGLSSFAFQDLQAIRISYINQVSVLPAGLTMLCCLLQGVAVWRGIQAAYACNLAGEGCFAHDG
jgi:hypothetical protein